MDAISLLNSTKRHQVKKLESVRSKKSKLSTRSKKSEKKKEKEVNCALSEVDS
jgi:hypothetical protein